MLERLAAAPERAGAVAETSVCRPARAMYAYAFGDEATVVLLSA